jgi:PPOX class probable FMN-dependent enzyme
MLPPEDGKTEEREMTELKTRDALRAHYGEPSSLSLRKELERLDHHARAFIALSPFVVIASSDASGRADATPRGDAPGFVAVIDDRTLLLPDRRGNNRVDTMLNVAENPLLGLIFFVPGINETLRINGRATIITDAALLTPLAAQGKVPTAGLLIRTEEIYFHCGKALIRSDLWNPERHVERSRFPSLGRILADQIADVTCESAEQLVEESYRTRLY